MRLISVFLLSVTLTAIQDPTLPDYRNKNEASYRYSEICQDQSVTHFFTQNRTSDFYLLYETTVKSTDVYFRVTYIAGENKVDRVEYFIRTSEGTRPVEESEYNSKLTADAPEYMKYIQGKGDKCKVVVKDP